MRHSPPRTVDIPAESISPFSPLVPRQKARPKASGYVIAQSLGADVFLIVISLLMGVLFSRAIGVANGAADLGNIIFVPPRWFIFLVCGAPAVIGFCSDLRHALSQPHKLPFARSHGLTNSDTNSRTKALYAKRLHLILLGLYFTAILVALCWSAPSMLLISKVFVSAVFSIALYALGQSIPSMRASFVISGCLFLVVLVATQAFIVLTLEADSAREKQEVLNGVKAIPGASGKQQQPPAEGVKQRRVVVPGSR